MRKRQFAVGSSIPAVIACLVLSWCVLTLGGWTSDVWADGDSKEQAEPEVISLQSVKDLKTASNDYDYIFVILTEGSEPNETVRGQVLSAVKNTEKEARFAVFEVSRSAEGFKKLARQYKVNKYPAVVAMSGKGNVETIQGDISETKIEMAFAKISGEKRKLTCPVSEGKACDPKACGKK
ncbi:MAG: hypothetical protein ABIA59_04850 [Candidatus Latescibacterota bacterium]